MPNCPNCGQTTARTEDWACQWCGYPLLFKSYKKISKTYKQLKGEKLLEQEPPVGGEPEPIPESEAELVPEPEPKLALESEPELILEPEPVPKPKPKRVPKSKRKPVLKPEPELIPEPEPAPKPKPKPVPKAKRKPVLEPEPEPMPAAIELTVKDLLSAYEADGEAADAKFANKILKVKGVVDRIEAKNILDIYYITLTSAEKKLLQNVRCMFDKKYGPELNQLTKGQTVTVQGKYDGSIINMRIIDCVLVH